MTPGQTIAAISSATGTAARMILRLSGPDSINISQKVWAGPIGAPPGNGAFRGQFRFRDLTIPGWIYIFRSPRSYSGEDTVELHIPGNPLLARLLLDELLKLGARAAEPGEFTFRAYMNGRIDLTEAEGVAATIAAGNEQELIAARQLLSGELARRLAPMIDSIADTLALLEAGIDFSDEPVSFISRDELAGRIRACDDDLDKLLRDAARFEKLSHEPRVVLVGRPNAGKSTLINRLCGSERAVVSSIAGTTRDVLWAEAALERGMVRVADVAGLEDSAADAPSHIEGQMQEHALRAIEQADVVVHVRETGDARPPIATPTSPRIWVLSKCDRASTSESTDAGTSSDHSLKVSAHTGFGLAALRHALDAACFGAAAVGASLALNVRHVRAIDQAREALSRALAAEGGAEFTALELREALDALGSILGRISPDDLLGRIFSTFCIGK